MDKKNRVIGVLGGKGPEATKDLFWQIIKNTPVHKEEDHFRVIIDNNPQIPKPALYITGEGENPLPAFIETAKNIERAHADFIVIPCNTAYCYIDEIQKHINIPIVNLITETILAVQSASCKSIGLLGSTGLIKNGIYQSEFEKANISVLMPEEKDQDELMANILHFKNKGEKRELRKTLNRIIKNLILQGAEGIVLGCTELPLVLSDCKFPVPSFNTIEILALAAIREATKGKEKNEQSN